MLPSENKQCRLIERQTRWNNAIRYNRCITMDPFTELLPSTLIMWQAHVLPLVWLLPLGRPQVELAAFSWWVYAIVRIFPLSESTEWTQFERHTYTPKSKQTKCMQCKPRWASDWTNCRLGQRVAFVYTCFEPANGGPDRPVRKSFSGLRF